MPLEVGVEALVLLEEPGQVAALGLVGDLGDGVHLPAEDTSGRDTLERSDSPQAVGPGVGVLRAQQGHLVADAWFEQRDGLPTSGLGPRVAPERLGLTLVTGAGLVDLGVLLLALVGLAFLTCPCTLVGSFRVGRAFVSASGFAPAAEELALLRLVRTHRGG